MMSNRQDNACSCGRSSVVFEPQPAEWQQTVQIDPKICSRLNAGGQPRGQNYGLCYDGLIVLIVALLGWLPFLQVSRVRVCD